jgi:cyclic pyranopterin phosphate synthase
MVTDRLSRPLRNLRLSVTDRCNLRCQYCMPEADYIWLPRESILRFEEVERVVDAFLALGVDKVRLTGGEPLLRKDLPILVERLAQRPTIKDLALTTNGVLLSSAAQALHDAGLHRLTVSLDTLRPERFKALTRYDELDRVLEGIDVASAIFTGIKIDTVVLKGTNDDELVDILEFGRQRHAEVRFIEYMDVGGATNWSMSRVMTRDEILATLEVRYGRPEALIEQSSAPASRYRLPDGTTFGIIASTTAPFCADCDRSRVTADGVWYRCLYASAGLDLRGVLRSGASDEAIQEIIRETWAARTDRGAEDRLAARDRSALIPVDTLRRDPHLEMHTRGG